jgi:N-acetylneuraminic acid mutarotase
MRFYSSPFQASGVTPWPIGSAVSLASLGIALAALGSLSCGSRTGLLEGPRPDGGVPDAASQDAGAQEADLPEEGGTLVLFSGQNAQSFFDDTWTFDGGTWSKVSTPVSPPARVDANMATLGNEVVLFGGYNNDTWTFDGITWSEVTTQPSPEPRLNATMASTGRALVLFGGWSPTGAALNNTWTFDGSRWSEVRGTSPSARAYASMASLGDEVVLFGGADDNGTPLNDTWLFDGTSWSAVAVSSPPPARYNAFEATIGGQVFLFGGFSGSVSSGFGLMDTWAFDGTTWSPVSVPSLPPWVWSSVATLDAEIVLFGGADNGYLKDTWTFDGSTWTEQTPAESPAGRVNAAMAFLR